jgi:hypothetical protein
MNQRFNEAASGKSRQAGSDKEEGKTGEERGSAGSGGSAEPKEQQKGWKARRNAAQRQAEGTYNPRNRPGRGRDRGSSFTASLQRIRQLVQKVANTH